MASTHIEKADAAQKAKLTPQEQIEQQILLKLLELGGQLVHQESIEFGEKFMLPEQYKNDLQGAIDFLISHKVLMDEPTDTTRVFDFKPWDGALAVQNALRKHFGTKGHQRGRSHWLFGDMRAQQRSIPIGPNKSANVPWGQIDIPIFQGKMHLGATKHKEKGLLFQLMITAPGKYQAAVEGLFMLVQQELEENSIYKGQAFDGQEEPEFLNVEKLEESKIVYSDEVLLHLEANVWSFVKHGSILERAGLDPKRAVLLEGPYGTGKTLAGLWTAKLAKRYGVTFVLCRPTDDLHEVMGTARLYQPSIVFFEDIDKLATPEKPDAINELLDTFDGMRAKGNRVMIVMTTNHKEKIHKGMLRPGRMDALIHIGAIDDIGGIKRMIAATLEEGMVANDLNYEKIAHACRDYLPAFVKETIQRAVMYSIAREPKMRELRTQDFVDAADGLRAQYELMVGAREVSERPQMESAMERVVRNAMDKTAVHDLTGEYSEDGEPGRQIREIRTND